MRLKSINFSCKSQTSLRRQTNSQNLLTKWLRSMRPQTKLWQIYSWSSNKTLKWQLVESRGTLLKLPNLRFKKKKRTKKKYSWQKDLLKNVSCESNVLTKWRLISKIFKKSLMDLKWKKAISKLKSLTCSCQ